MTQLLYPTKSKFYLCYLFGNSDFTIKKMLK